MRIHPIPPEFNVKPRLCFKRWISTSDSNKKTEMQDPQTQREFYFDENKGVWIDYMA